MGYSKSNTSPIFELPVSARRTDGADPEALTPQITPPPQATYAQYAATSHGGHGYWHASGDLHRQCPLWVISGHQSGDEVGPLCAMSGHKRLRIIAADPKHLRAEIGFAAIPHTGASKPRGQPTQKRQRQASRRDRSRAEVRTGRDPLQPAKEASGPTSS